MGDAAVALFFASGFGEDQDGVVTRSPPRTPQKKTALHLMESNEDAQLKVKQACNVNEAQARQLLETCAGDPDAAVALFFASGFGEERDGVMTRGSVKPGSEE